MGHMSVPHWSSLSQAAKQAPWEGWQAVPSGQSASASQARAQSVPATHTAPAGHPAPHALEHCFLPSAPGEPRGVQSSDSHSSASLQSSPISLRPQAEVARRKARAARRRAVRTFAP